MGRTHLENGFAGFQGEADFEEEYEFEDEADFEDEYESDEVLNEEEVDELASELLEVSNEAELEQFLGGLIKKVGSAAGNFIRSPLGQQVGSALKSVAKKALPLAGQALGNYVAPGIGGQIGGQLASAAGSMFGLELEGLSHEDGEFEVAKQFVRLAADATSNAIAAPPAANAREVASHAVAQATQKFAPGLQTQAGGSRGAASGRWVRKGRKIVIYGV
jgi:uncharacterized protein (DUF697 family)